MLLMPWRQICTRASATLMLTICKRSRMAQVDWPISEVSHRNVGHLKRGKDIIQALLVHVFHFDGSVRKCGNSSALAAVLCRPVRTYYVRMPVTSYEGHSVLNHQHHGLLNSLFRLTMEEHQSSVLRVTGPLWGESICQLSIVSS